MDENKPKSNDVSEFLAKMGMKEKPEEKPIDPYEQWDRIITPKSSNIILGDVGTGKSGLAYWLVERYARKYGLTPATVGIPPGKQSLLPGFRFFESPDEITSASDIMVFIDEADLQLPLEDVKAREYVTNFLMMYRQRNMVMLLGFHYPRLVVARYLPSFSVFLLKRPPFLREFASKGKNDALSKMMDKAEERFAELVPPDFVPSVEHMHPLEVVRNTYVVAPRVRWQGLLPNPTSSFWSEKLSEIWAGTEIEKTQNNPRPKSVELPGFDPGQLMSSDGTTPITPDMRDRKVCIENNPTCKVYIDPFTNTQWVEYP